MDRISRQSAYSPRHITEWHHCLSSGRIRQCTHLSFVFGLMATIYFIYKMIYTRPGYSMFPVLARNISVTHLKSRKRPNLSYTDDSNLRIKELRRLGELVQRRLNYIQNPIHCESAKKVFCNFTETKKVGFGSLMHDGIICLLVAYATQRTLIIESRGMPYSKRGMDSMFQPLSANCTSIKGQRVKRRKVLDDIENDIVISLPRHSEIRKRPDYFPLAIPEDLAANLTRVHTNPSGWWIGQLLIYLMRYNDSLRQLIEQRMANSGFEHPIVGVQVRRTDKTKEARYHDLGEYMKHVEEWFVVYEKEHGPVQRKVFIASDDTGIFKEATRRFPRYTFISNKETSELASELNTRYSEGSLRGFLMDVEMLSTCDFFVCTMSSSVARLVYERMHVRHWDAPSRIKSLDIDYAFHRIFFKNSKHAQQKYGNNKNASVFVNMSETGMAIVNLDNLGGPVSMPRYPLVPVL